MMRKNGFLPTLLIICLGIVSLTLFCGRSENPDCSTSHSILPSTYNTGKFGMKGFYLILNKWQSEIHRWRRPLYALDKGAEPAGTLVME